MSHSITKTCQSTRQPSFSRYCTTPGGRHAILLYSINITTMIKIKFEFNIHVLKEGNTVASTLTTGKQVNSTEELVKKVADFFAISRLEIDKAERKGRFSTARNYQTAIRSLRRFVGKAELPLHLMDGMLMEQYQRWLREKGICPNTSSCYMRSLRALYNRAAAEAGIETGKPFGKVYTGHAETVKRSVSTDDIRSIRRADLRSKPSLELTRDIFLFCYYAMGMPFVDVAFLRKDNIKDGFIVYYRHKTGQQIRIKLESCMYHIMKKYEQADRPYLFPIISSEEQRLAHHQYVVALGRYNRCLKRIARIANVESNLTSYVVRHSWASNAYEQNVDLPVISKALGHTDTQTTLIYIRGINDQRLEHANRKLLKNIQK